jgi:tripartite-type tricarboxylate transporter receptor subunit TctC
MEGRPSDRCRRRKRQRLHEDLEFSGRLKTPGVDPDEVAGDAFAAVIATDMEEWRKRVSEMGLQSSSRFKARGTVQ